MTPKRRLLFAFVVAIVPMTSAFGPGSQAFTKRIETVLRVEPGPLAPVAARVGYAQVLTVDEVKGTWLHVREGMHAGWVFSGNVSEEKPSDPKGLDIPVGASRTTATAAARPLEPAAEKYSERKGLDQARQDILWLEARSDSVSSDDVDAFLKANSKGEYQP
jgi:hypothetical protein